MESGVPLSVALVDDHPVVRAGISAWCAAADVPIKVVAEGSDVSVALHGPGRTANVVVLDLMLRDGRFAYDELHELVTQERKVVVYTMRDSQEAALTCMDLGSATFITKAEGQRHLVKAILAAAADIPYTPPSLAGAFGSDTRQSRPVLSVREVEVLVEWFQSESKAMVAQSLGISERTVNTYLDRVRIKYANAGRPATTKAKLVARAVQDGLISLDEL
ncbi:response regulator [Streptomyces sp. NPDC018031]|uniref:response regulator n=1 Tax=Streptomyces sp. NPDC018031 TaxID=3365033 RepID=UPI0037B8E180